MLIKLYTFVIQECTILYDKSVQYCMVKVYNLIVRWLFRLKTEFEWTDEPVLVALNAIS